MRGRFVFLKLAGAGKDGVPFPHSSFFKTLKFFFIYLFFLQNTISVPISSPTVQESLTLRRGWDWVGSGDWSEKVQDIGKGSGFEHHENPAGATGLRRPTGRARTHRGRRESLAAGGPWRGGQDGLGSAGGRVFPKMNK